jgi:hypothetical protein
MPALTGLLQTLIDRPNIRRIQTGWSLATVSAVAATVAILVFAYDAGGGVLVGVFGGLRAAAAPMTPLVISFGDRLGLGAVLRLTLATRTVLLLVAGTIMVTDAPALIAVVLVAANDALAAAYRPLQAAALPWLAHTPAELTRANVTSGVMESSGTLLGSAAGALLLSTGSTGLVAFAASGAVAAALVSVTRLSVPVVPVDEAGEAERPRLVEGARALWSIATGGGAAVLPFVQTFVRGALVVLLVVLALDVLDIGEGAVGWMNASIALGGLVGGVLAATAVTSRRLGRSFVLGVALWGLPLVALGLVASPVVAFVALAVVGVGNALEDSGLFTLLPRVVDERLVTRTFAAFELGVFVAAGAGSLTAPVLLDLLGARPTLVLLGAGLAVLAVLYYRPFRRIDESAPSTGAEAELLRSLPMFEHVALATVEHIAARLEPHEFAPGDVVMRQGDPGTSFHLIDSGRASVTVDGTEKPELGRGEGFGEIALIRDIPRTATVTALTPLRTLALSADDFGAALTIQQHSAQAAAELARRRLASDPAADGDQDPRR